MTRSEIQASCFSLGRNPIVPFVGALCTYREARGETANTQFAQACSVVNRVLNPKWWGSDILTVVLKPWQYSSFNMNDPNNVVWPLGIKRPNTNLHGLYENRLLTSFIRSVMEDAQQSTDVPDVNDAWYSCLNAFNNAVRGVLADPTLGATSYYDKSLDYHPPNWAVDGSEVLTATVGRLRFWKEAHS